MRCVLIPSCLLLVACGGSAPRAGAPAPIALADMVPVRTISLRVETDDPQPAWNPAVNQIVVRSQDGFSLIEEGRPPVHFGAEDRRFTGYPQWIDARRVVFGGRDNVVRTPEGRVVPSADGITEVTIDRTVTDKRQVWNSGWRPRVGRDALWAQVADRIWRIADGEPEEFGPGFFAEPQRDGAGVCWQETPVTSPDLWTQHRGIGALIVRWKPGVVTTYPRCLQARWVAGGGLVATRIKADPPATTAAAGAATGAWWLGGTEVVFIADDQTAPRVVLDNARDPDPNPRFAVIAARSAKGPIQVVTLDGTDATAVAPGGERPQWNFDGTRLLYETTAAPDAAARGAAAAPQPVVRVEVFAVRQR